MNNEQIHPPQLVSHCHAINKHTVFSIQQVSDQNQIFFQLNNCI